MRKAHWILMATINARVIQAMSYQEWLRMLHEVEYIKISRR